MSHSVPLKTTIAVGLGPAATLGEHGLAQGMTRHVLGWLGRLRDE